MKTTRQLEWLAGLLEGEGSFMLMKGSPCVAVQMTDRDVVARVAEIMEVPMSEYKYKPKGKPSYLPVFYVRIWGTHAIEWMMTLYTLMGTRRKAKIKEVIEAWKASPAMPRASRGTSLPALCHPNLPRTGNGLCKKCYMRAWRDSRKGPDLFPPNATPSSMT